MRVILQRVTEASVSVAGTQIGAIGHGFLVLVGFTHGDTTNHVEWMAEKVAGLRLFDDEGGKMNLALADVTGEILVVSQFTVYGDAAKGRRPSFVAAASPAHAIPLYELFIGKLRDRGIGVATGEFGADMRVSLVNDGPVTLVIDRD